MPDLAVIVLLGALAGAPTAAQVAPPTPPPALPAFSAWGQALTARQRDQLERWLGPSRLRRLERARFHLGMSAAEPFHELSDHPATFEEVRDSLKGAYVKLLQTALEERLEIDARLDRLGERLGTDGSAEVGGLGLRIAPRLNLGSHGSLGLKLGLRSRERAWWSRSTLELRQRLEGSGYSVALRFDDGDRFFQLEHRGDDGRHGASWSLDFRLSF